LLVHQKILTEILIAMATGMALIECQRLIIFLYSPVLDGNHCIIWMISGFISPIQQRFIIFIALAFFRILATVCTFTKGLSRLILYIFLNCLLFY